MDEVLILSDFLDLLLPNKAMAVVLPQGVEGGYFNTDKQLFTLTRTESAGCAFVQIADRTGNSPAEVGLRYCPGNKVIEID